MSKISKLANYGKNLIRYVRYGGIVYMRFFSVDAMQLLDNKHVVVTGGGKGLGFQMAKRFLSAGASVTITGRHETKLLEAIKSLNSDKVDYMVWDVCDISITPDVIAKLIEKHSRIDAFVNNAGVYFPEDSKFFGQKEENWDTTLNTNLKGLHFACQEEIHHLISNGGGKIINITSIGGVRSGYVPYDLSKSAANTLTKALAKRYTKDGVIINAIAPGEMPTEMGTPRDVNGNIYYGGQRNHRLTLTEEVAELALFLLSDGANNIAGQVICCDGGASIF